ncbi:hypothetical protein [Heliorestis convoluta]|uniref:Uncharacterized protein n=1 Tax=Heliorestis convoluta TaxID=356322 RepID=A0A5Q2N233_9FIRM|nr:hypothetical protein [Heliorestis convoluta]QGG47352.1 hypothetical protein FTV88_1205 [Heliorestis convoluta]
MDPQDFMDQFYLSLLEQGWTLPEIDQMDIFYYLQLLKRKMEKPQSYIDEIL